MIKMGITRLENRKAHPVEDIFLVCRDTPPVVTKREMYIKNLAHEALRHIGIDRAQQESTARANESELLALAGTTPCCLKIRRRQGLGDAQKRHSLSLVVLVSNASAELLSGKCGTFQADGPRCAMGKPREFSIDAKGVCKRNRWFYQDCSMPEYGGTYRFQLCLFSTVSTASGNNSG